MKKVKTFLKKYQWWIFGVVFSYPFYCLLIGKIWNFGELYTFGLPLNEFMTVWFTLGGIIGVVSNIRLTQKRMTEQQKQFSNTRFSSGVEVLGNQNESARIGGVYTLYFLAREYPNDYLETVCEILCAHIRTITSNKEYQEKYKEKPSNEIQTIINLLFKKNNEDLIFDNCKKNLRETFFVGANFYDAKLSNVNFFNAKLSNLKYSEGSFRNAKLSNIQFLFAELGPINFDSAKLINVKFPLAKLKSVYFTNAELRDVDFKNAEISKVNFNFAKLNSVNYDSGIKDQSDIDMASESHDPTNQIRSAGDYIFIKDLADHFLRNDFSDIDFSGATLYEVNFKGTSLQNYNYEEITREGCSLELTKNKELSAEAMALFKNMMGKEKTERWTTNW